MVAIQALFRALRAMFAYCREAGGVESHDAAVHADCDCSRRMNGISDSYKALLLASPGR